MKMMKKTAVLLLVLLATSATAGAQEYSSDPYDFILAKLAAGDGRFEEALATIDKLTAHQPQNPVLIYERALILLDASKPDAAEADLRKVVALQPSFYDAERVLGRLLLDRAGTDHAKMEEALSHLQAAYRLYPDDLATGMAVSQILLSTNRTAEAEKVLSSMLERAPDQRGLNYNYAQVLTKLGRGDESRRFLERAVEVDPTFGPAILQLIDLYQKSNEWGRAAELLQPLVNDDPANLDLQRQQGFFYLRAGMTEKARDSFRSLVKADPKDTRTQYYLAEALSDLEQFPEADQLYRRLLEKTPDDLDVLASFGLSQMGQRRFDEAGKTFRTLLALPEVPDNVQVLARTQLALIDLQKGNYGAAVEAARPILVFRDKLNSQAINIALDALKKQNRFADGVALLQPLTEKFASDPFVNARYIELLVRAGDKDRARIAAATQSKFGVRNSIGAAEAYITAGQYESAIAVLRDAQRTKPDDVDLQFELGSAYERSGDKAGAEKLFLQLLEKHPEHTGTLNYLGYMWAESGTNLDRAADMLNRAVTQEPHNGAYIDSLGWVYFRQGKLDLAEKYLTDATHLLPRDPTVHEHLGDVLAKRGETVRALSLYRAALTLDPESKDGPKIKVKIAELERLQQGRKTTR